MLGSAQIAQDTPRAPTSWRGSPARDAGAAGGAPDVRRGRAASTVVDGRVRKEPEIAPNCCRNDGSHCAYIKESDHEHATRSRKRRSLLVTSASASAVSLLPAQFVAAAVGNAIRPFRINVLESELVDLRRRLAGDLVMPSIPGYGFSGRRTGTGSAPTHRASLGGADEAPRCRPAHRRQISGYRPGA